MEKQVIFFSNLNLIATGFSLLLSSLTFLFDIFPGCRLCSGFGDWCWCPCPPGARWFSPKSTYRQTHPLTWGLPSLPPSDCCSGGDATLRSPGKWWESGENRKQETWPSHLGNQFPKTPDSATSILITPEARPSPSETNPLPIETWLRAIRKENEVWPGCL